MIRGTTAQFKFDLPYSFDSLEFVTIKFWQPGNPSEMLPIKKTKTNCYSPSGSTELYVSLSASETKEFSDKYKARVQLRAQVYGGSSFGSRQQLITVYPMLDEIIEDGTTTEPSTPTESRPIILDGGEIV